MAAETGRVYDRRLLIRGLAESIVKWYRCSGEEILNAYRKHWVMRNRPVHVRVQDGWLAGIAADINHDASMRVLTDDGTVRHVHSSADIRLVSA